MSDQPVYVATNRQLSTGRKGINAFGYKPNENGPNELRLVEVSGSGKHVRVKVLPDKATAAQVKRLNRGHRLKLDPNKACHASFIVACDAMARARKEKKHLLFYVHGYNNDISDVLANVRALEGLYNVIVLPFSWPANGGGAVSGTAAYLSDKKDARASADALNSFIAKVHAYHTLLTEARTLELQERARKKFPNNPMARREYFSELQSEECRVSLNLLCHSMGNYLLKQALKSSNVPAGELVFDNISLVAADTNNAAHAEWVERLQVRHRVNIIINEEDFALKWSRRKPGEAQKERLGHSLNQLNAHNARYLDVTHAEHVGSQHSYFVGKAPQKNDALRQILAAALEGGSPESMMRYRADLNAYEL